MDLSYSPQWKLTKEHCGICGQAGISRHGGWWCPWCRQWNLAYQGTFKETPRSRSALG